MYLVFVLILLHPESTHIKKLCCSVLWHGALCEYNVKQVVHSGNIVRSVSRSPDTTISPIVYVCLYLRSCIGFPLDAPTQSLIQDVPCPFAVRANKRDRHEATVQHGCVHRQLLVGAQLP